MLLFGCSKFQPFQYWISVSKKFVCYFMKTHRKSTIKLTQWHRFSIVRWRWPSSAAGCNWFALKAPWFHKHRSSWQNGRKGSLKWMVSIRNPASFQQLHTNLIFSRRNPGPSQSRSETKHQTIRAGNHRTREGSPSGSGMFGRYGRTIVQAERGRW